VAKFTASVPMLTITALGVQRLKSFMAITTLADGENVMVRKKKQVSFG